MRHFALCCTIALVVFSVPSKADSYVVDPGGTGDFPNIQAAIEAALDGDIIELTDGIFRGAENHNLDFGGRRITVRSQSGNPGACIIDCGGDPEELHRGFFFHSGEDSQAVVRGLTIANGRAWLD